MKSTMNNRYTHHMANKKITGPQGASNYIKRLILVKVSVSCFISSYAGGNGTRTTGTTCVGTVSITTVGTAFTRFTASSQTISIAICFTRFSTLITTSGYTIASTATTTIAPTVIGTKGAYGART